MSVNFAGAAMPAPGPEVADPAKSPRNSCASYHIRRRFNPRRSPNRGHASMSPRECQGTASVGGGGVALRENQDLTQSGLPRVFVRNMCGFPALFIDLHLPKVAGVKRILPASFQAWPIVPEFLRGLRASAHLAECPPFSRAAKPMSCRSNIAHITQRWIDPCVSRAAFQTRLFFNSPRLSPSSGKRRPHCGTMRFGNGPFRAAAA